MLPSTDELHEAWKRSNFGRYKITFLVAMNTPMYFMCLTRLAENAAKTAAEGKPAPNKLARYGD